jgi:hypothetical protein
MDNEDKSNAILATGGTLVLIGRFRFTGSAGASVPSAAASAFAFGALGARLRFTGSVASTIGAAGAIRISSTASDNISATNTGLTT